MLNVKNIRAAEDFGSAIKMVMEGLNLTYEKIYFSTGLSPKTLRKMINHYDIDVSEKSVFLLILGIHQKFEVSKILLKKAGICKSSSPVAQAYWHILENIDDFVDCEENVCDDNDFTSENINSYLEKQNIPEKYFLHTCF